MSASLIQLSRVDDDGYIGCKVLSTRQDDDIPSKKKSRQNWVPAVAVILVGRALIGIIGCQAFVGRWKGCMWNPIVIRLKCIQNPSTWEWMRKTEFRKEGWNLKRFEGTPRAKAVFWYISDAKERKRGEWKGLETPCNPRRKLCWFCLWSRLSASVNARNQPPGEYGRKAEIQRNRRGLKPVVEYVV